MMLLLLDEVLLELLLELLDEVLDELLDEVLVELLELLPLSLTRMGSSSDLFSDKQALKKMSKNRLFNDE